MCSQHPFPISLPQGNPQKVPFPTTTAFIREGSLQLLGTEPAGNLHQEKLKQPPKCSSSFSLVGLGSSGFVPEVKHISVVPCIKSRVATLRGVSYTSKYWGNSCRQAGHRWYSQVAHGCLRGHLQGTQSCVLLSHTSGGELRQGCLTPRRMKTHVGAGIASDPEGTSAP